MQYVTVDTKIHSLQYIQKNILFFYLLKKLEKSKVEKIKTTKKLLNFLFQLLILLIIIDRAMSQCGIRWRGTCDTKSNAGRRQI